MNHSRIKKAIKLIKQYVDKNWKDAEKLCIMQRTDANFYDRTFFLNKEKTIKIDYEGIPNGEIYKLSENGVMLIEWQTIDYHFDSDKDIKVHPDLTLQKIESILQLKSKNLIQKLLSI